MEAEEILETARENNLIPSHALPETGKPRVVIVGGGFGGIQLARQLVNKPFQVVLLDRNNYHTFQPLLYQVATGGLEPASIAYPLRRLFKDCRNLHFRMAEVLRVVPDKNYVETNIGALHYDYLVLATGSKTAFFGLENVERMAARMKTIPQALDLRSIILQNFEEALELADSDSRVEQMNVIVVGGGPTGVETAGALGELKRYVLPKDYPELDISRMQIYIVEAGPALLGAMSNGASEKSKKYLEKLGVNVWLNSAVKDYDGHRITLADGDQLTGKTVIWCAGVTGNPVGGFPQEQVARGNRVKVDQYCRTLQYDNIYAIGDVAQMASPELPAGHPMLAQVAIQQGRLVGKNFIRWAAGKQPEPFEYKDLGTMATIGRNKAVADLPKIKFQGAFAWFVWMFVHLMSLVGFRNKVVVFIDWFWNYISYDRSLRLIIRPFKR